MCILGEKLILIARRRSASPSFALTISKKISNHILIITIIFTHQIQNFGPNQKSKSLLKPAKMALPNTGGAIPACSLPLYVDLTPKPSVLSLITDTEVTDTLHIPERVNIILGTNGILMIYEMIATT